MRTKIVATFVLFLMTGGLVVPSPVVPEAAAVEIIEQPEPFRYVRDPDPAFGYLMVESYTDEGMRARSAFYADQANKRMDKDVAIDLDPEALVGIDAVRASGRDAPYPGPAMVIAHEEHAQGPGQSYFHGAAQDYAPDAEASSTGREGAGGGAGTDAFYTVRLADGGNGFKAIRLTAWAYGDGTRGPAIASSHWSSPILNGRLIQAIDVLVVPKYFCGTYDVDPLCFFVERQYLHDDVYVAVAYSLGGSVAVAYFHFQVDGTSISMPEAKKFTTHSDYGSDVSIDVAVIHAHDVMYLVTSPVKATFHYANGWIDPEGDLQWREVEEICSACKGMKASIAPVLDRRHLYDEAGQPLFSGISSLHLFEERGAAYLRQGTNGTFEVRVATVLLSADDVFVPLHLAFHTVYTVAPVLAPGAQVREIGLVADHFSEIYFDIRNPSIVFTNKSLIAVAGVATTDTHAFGFDALLNWGDRLVMNLMPVNGAIQPTGRAQPFGERVPFQERWRGNVSEGGAFALTELPAFRPGMDARPAGPPTLRMTQQYPVALIAPAPLIDGLGQSPAIPPSLSTSSSTSSSEGESMLYRGGGIVGFEVSNDWTVTGLAWGLGFELRVGGEWGTEKTVTIGESSGFQFRTSNDGPYLALLANQVRSQRFEVQRSSFVDRPTPGSDLHTAFIDEATPLVVARTTPLQRYLDSDAGRNFDFSGLLMFQPGDPASFPTSTDIPPACRNARTDIRIDVIDGSTSTPIGERRLAHSTEEIRSTAIDVGLEAWGKVLGVKAGGYFGYTEGSSMGVEVGTETTFESATGDIPGDYGGTENYTWGPLSCRATIHNTAPAFGQPSALEIWYLGHWVEDYDGLGPMQAFVPIQDPAPTDGEATGMAPTLRWDAPWDPRGTFVVEWEGVETSESGTVRIDVPDEGPASVSLPQLGQSAALYRWRVVQERPDGETSDASTWNTFRPYAAPTAPADLAAVPQSDGSILIVFEEPTYNLGLTYEIATTLDGEHQVLATVTDSPALIQDLPPGTHTIQVRTQAPAGGDLPALSAPATLVVDTRAPLRIFADDWRPLSHSTVRVQLAATTALTDPEVTGPGVITRPDPSGPWVVDIRTEGPGTARYTVTADASGGGTVTQGFLLRVQNRSPTITLEHDPRDVSTAIPLEVQWSVSDPDTGITSLTMDAPDMYRVIYADGLDQGTVEVRIDEPGEHRICAEVRDALGATDRTCILVDAPNQPPRAAWNTALVDAPIAAGTPLPLEDLSSDDVSVTRVLWDFGDGRFSTEHSPLHAYASAGEYLLCLTAWDDHGTSDTACRTVAVTNLAPTVRVVGPTVAVAGQAVVYEAISGDDDGRVMRHEWDRTGPAPDDGSGSTYETVFPDPGAYTLCVTVFDDHGDEDRECLDVAVTAQGPEASVITSTTDAVVGVAMEFFADIRAHEGRIVRTFWTIQGMALGTGSALPHTFHDPGIHEVCLHAVDEWGATGTGCRDIEVRMPDAPRPRWSVLTATPKVFLPVQISDDSLATERPIVARAWTIDGAPRGDAAVLETVLGPARSAQVCLSVTDDLGHEASHCDDLVLAATVPPSAAIVRLTDDPLTVKPTRFADASAPGDGPLAGGAWRADGVPFSDASVLEWLYPESGLHEVCRDVVDAFGVQAGTCQEVPVREPRLPRPDWVTLTVDQMYLLPLTFDDETMPGEGVVVGREWLVDDVVVGHNEVLTHQFTDPGEHELCLRATDEWGRDASRCRTVSLLPPEPPEAAWAVDPPLVVTLDEMTLRDVSIPGHGQIVDRTWTIDGITALDGTDLPWTFDRPGPHEVCLDVRDTWNQTDQSCATILVANRAPLADALVSELDHPVGDPIHIPSASADADGTIVETVWTVNNQTIPAGDDGSLTFTPRECGHVDVTVTVRDDFGATNTTGFLLHVWDLLIQTPTLDVDRVTLDASPVYSIDQGVPPVHVPGVQHAVCHRHDPLMVTGEHTHGP